MAKTAPIVLAEKQIDKQVKAIQEAPSVPDPQKDLLSDGLNGIKRLLQTIDQISDPDNPPEEGSLWAKIVALGKNQRRLTGILVPEGEDGDGKKDTF